MEGVMKKRLMLVAVIMSIVLLADISSGQAQNQNLIVVSNSLPIGSVSKVTDYAVSVVTAFLTDVYQVQPDGTLLYFAFETDNRQFSSKQELDAWFHTRVNQGVQNILSSTNGNKDGDFYFRVFAINGPWGYALFNCYKSFKLIHTNSQYYLPSFDGYQLTMASRIPFLVPDIQWAILEAQGLSVPVFDSRRDPDYWANGGLDLYYADLLVLKAEHITGNYDIKLSMVSGTNNTYRIFDKNGALVPETPVVVSPPKLTNGTCSVSVTGGDPGRHLVLQGSTNLVTWTDLRPDYVVYYSGYDPGFTYSETSNYPRRFFRVKKVNSPY